MRRLAITLFLCLLLNCIQAQLPPLQQKAILLKRVIELRHYSPRAINDSFSLAVFQNLINAADSRRIYFTAGEYKQLQTFSLKLDDELNGNGWGFYELFSKTYKQALQRVDTMTENLLKKPFDFSKDESSIAVREDLFIFPTDVNALRDKWNKRLKVRMLTWIFDETFNDTVKKISFNEALTSKEATTRERLKKGVKKGLKKIMNPPQGYDAHIAELYLNAIANAFDPHSNYFSARSGEEYKAGLSTESMAFGIELGENEQGQIIINRLVPGGPAWKSGELHEGDVLEKLQWEGKEAVDMSSAELDEAYEILDQSSTDRLVFTFKKTDGSHSIVLLRKEKIENEDNIVKGFVLNGEKKIGYILLPGFYTEWENETGSGCANDVAKAIIRLKRENIEGLILDVRFNGGGSVGEALEMGGIFIEEGPLASQKMKDGKQLSLKDPNRGTIYDGPMALVINGQSASASELLAATLQDYNRAVIVGSRTFGKATGQVVFSLDTISTKASPAPNKDAAKITIGKLYRLTGETAQFNGVTPDVILPDAFDAVEHREEFLKYALTPDTAKRNTLYKPLKPLPVSELSGKSQQRVGASEQFNEVRKLIVTERKLNGKIAITIPLKWDLFEKWVKENDPDYFPDNGKEWISSKFKVENHAGDKELIKNNSYAREINEMWLENIATDFYVEETFLILLDLINLIKK